MLTDPKWPVYALGTFDWKAAVDAGIRELPEPVAWVHINGSCGVTAPPSCRVLPRLTLLSLILSLQDNADDRIQIALDELKEQLPW